MRITIMSTMILFAIGCGDGSPSGQDAPSPPPPRAAPAPPLPESPTKPPLELPPPPDQTEAVRAAAQEFCRAIFAKDLQKVDDLAAFPVKLKTIKSENYGNPTHENYTLTGASQLIGLKPCEHALGFDPEAGAMNGFELKIRPVENGGGKWEVVTMVGQFDATFVFLKREGAWLLESYSEG